ncbi:sulfatase family protein [Spirosoma spitsbergense]|uniref:sulfatase family protein n=1 Tax=Spirosoma spitsbergense TaxID=431554 RepID=UPI000369805E|nr:arylsulfatase [Spirosoma spitsbergense]
MKILLTLLIALASLGLSDLQLTATPEVNTKATLPNIVFILADDMGYGDPGCYNPDSKIPTPAINQLAREGMRFTDAHSAGSWCVPSRYGLVTGQYPMRKLMNIQLGGLINADRVTIASLLQKRGYHTGMVGKWHLGFDGVDNWDKVDYSQPLRGGPTDRGFDYFFGMHASLDIPPYFFIENKGAVVAPTESIAGHQSIDATTTISGAFWRAGKIAPGFVHADVLPTFTQKAISFMDGHQRKTPDKPFFLYLALTAPHTPWVAKPEFVGKSKAGAYGDFTTQVDYTVRQILDRLKKSGIDKNTIVIFSSDNGPVWFKEDVQKYNHQATGRLRGMKMDAYEGAHRMPFIVRWPGQVKAGSVSSQLLCFTDMLATFADVINEPLPKQLTQDSYSMLPVWLGRSKAERTGLVIETRTVRDGDWKLVFGNGTGSLHQHYGHVDAPAVSGELYDLKADPYEQRNLYNTNQQRVSALNTTMDNYRSQGSITN